MKQTGGEKGGRKLGRRALARYALSAFLVFHVAAVFILPNPDSILYRELEKVFVPYGNLLGMNTTWRFFSPNPLIQILEYRVLADDVSLDEQGRDDVGQDGDDDEQRIFRYPESLSSAGSREGYNRRLNNAMYMMSNKSYLQQYLGPHLCRRHPEADGLALYSVSREFPAIEQARLYRESRGDIERMIRVHLLDIDCEKGPL